MTPKNPIFQTLDRSEVAPYPTKVYLKRTLWQIVQATLFRLPMPLGYSYRRFLLRLFGATLTDRAAVHRTARIIHPWLLEMGDWSFIGPRVNVYNLGKITVGSHTLISQDVDLCAGTHDHTQPNLPLIRSEIRIGSGCWIGARAFIGPDSIIGDNSIVGAATVVFGTVPPGVVVVGNPAKVVRERAVNPAIDTPRAQPAILS
jgi:putative colanic acid biosynthesis acetyltransferase WcaF